MRLKFYYSTFLFLILFSQGILAQRTADFTFEQSTRNDTLYLDFKVKRTSNPVYDLGGYNIVFKIDTTIVDTTNARLFSQGFFGVKTTEYGPVKFIYLSANNYQLTLYKNVTSPATSALPDAYVSAGKVGFKIKGCGASNVNFTSPPFTTIVAWLSNSAAVVNENAVSPASIQVSGKSNAKLQVSKDTVCKNGSVTFTADLRSTFSNYTLFSRSSTGVNTLVAGPQASNVFPNVNIPSDNQYFVRFLNGATCNDTTTIIKVVAVDPQPALTINPPSPPVCLGNTLKISLADSNNNSLIWKLIPSTLAQFTNASSGVGVSSVDVKFPGINPYSVQLSVQDTNKFGCVSPVSAITINVVKCDLNPDFTINGSDVGISSCQNAFVTFRDKSTSSAGTIVKWSWDFGAGASPDTSSLKDPAPVMYSSAGIVNVKLTVTDNNGLSKTIIKSPTVRILSVLSTSPDPSCGSSSCNEVNFNWQPISEATSYEVKYKKGLKGTFTAFQNVSLASSFKVNASSPGMGGSLEFSDTKNDTVYFQIRAIAGNCDTALSNIVFCRPSFCSSSPGCSLPPDSISTPPSSCLGATVKINVFTTPKDFYNKFPYESVRFVWDNNPYDTSHSYSVKITTQDFQKVKLLTIDTLKPNCYSLKSISIPVGKTLTTKPDLGIQSLECDRVTFVWKHVEGALKYQIKYSGTCIGTTNFVDAPLNGQAEFFELTGLTNNCNVDFQVRAVGSCNNTQSDTLISPPTCTCFIGHIASSNLKSCALDTVDLKISNIQASNWMITWHDPVKNIDVSSKTDTTYRFVPDLPNKIYSIKYTLFDLSKSDSCKTVGFIIDTTSNSTSPEWNPIKTSFCISDVIFYLNDKAVNKGYQYSGIGIEKLNNNYYFDPAKAGLGTHTLVYNACGNKESHNVKVVDKPCVTTVVGGGNLLSEAQDLFTACDGTIYITDKGNQSIWRYLPTGTNGIPDLVAQSPGGGDIDGNILAARFGNPYGIVLDESTKNELYFTDIDRRKIKRVVFDKSRIETIAGQDVVGNNPNNNSPKALLSAARFSRPFGLAMHPNQDTLYVSDASTNSIKSFTFKGPSQQIKLVLGSPSGTLPGRGKSVNVRPRRIAVDSLGLSFTDNDGFIGRYQFGSDSARANTIATINGYKDGLPGQYLLRSVAGVTPQIGEWIFFTDSENNALRRIHAVTGYMETVAGSPPSNGPPSSVPTQADGNAFDSRFTDPTALSFNIKGYIDVLDVGPPVAVRRYFIPRWGLGTWDGFDSTYVVNCDRDTLSPNYSAGVLRQVSGKSNALITKTIFVPKDTGNYLLSYKIKVGRCDTTFFKNVYVKAQPKPTLNNDTICDPVALLSATAIRDTSVRYKWFGPDVRTLPLASVTSDTNRTVSVTVTGKYWVEIYFGKKKNCFVTDSAAIKIIKGQIGKINNDQTGNPKDSVTLCYGGTTKLSMDELSPTAPKFKTFLWSTGETTRAITASGSAVYRVIARDTLGCDITAKFKVLQQALPSICIKATDNTGKNLGWGTYTVSTFAGRPGVSGSANGKGSLATFRAPWGLTIYRDTLYVSDKNNKIRAVSLNDANVKDFLGTGSNAIVDSVSKNLAALNTPQGFRFDKLGNLYVANTGANNIAKYDRAKNLYYILAGSGTAFFTDSIGKLADLNQPYDLEVDPAGNVIFTDNQNHAIRTIDSRRRVRTLAGNPPNLGSADGKGRNASFNWPWGITSTPTGDFYIAEDANHTLRKLRLDTSVRLVAGGFNNTGSNSGKVGTSVPGLNARFNRPWNLTSDLSGNTYVTDANNGLIRMLDTKGNIITIAGRAGVSGNINGRADSATFSGSTGIVIDPKTQSIYVADQTNNTIRKLTKNKTVYVCKGNLYSLDDSCKNGNLRVRWKKKASNGTFVTQISGAPTNQADTGTFVMEVTYFNGCPNIIVTDTIKVRFHETDTTFRIPQPVGVGGLIEICQGDSLLLTSTPGYSLYNWGLRQGQVETPLGTTTNNTFKTVFLDAPNFGRLFVTVRNKTTGCLDRLRDIDERNLYVKPSLVANFKDSLKCLGNLTRFEPLLVDSVNNVYKWNFGDLTTINDSSNFPIGRYEYPVSGTFNVKMIVTDPAQNSCADTITKPVTISSLPLLTLSLNNGLNDSIRYCGTANPINLRANFTPDANTGSLYTYQWFETKVGGGLAATVTNPPINTNTASPVLSPTDHTSLFGYGVFVRDNKNCASNKDTVYARLSKTPIFNVSVSKSKICLGQSTTLTATDVTQPKGNPTDYSYKWFLAGQRVNSDTFSTASDFSVSPLISGTYILVVKNLVTGCTATVTSPFIEVIGFSYTLDKVMPPVPCSDPDSINLSGSFTGNPSSPLQVSWTDSATGKLSGALYNPTLLNAKIFRDSTRVLQLIIRDAVGCEDTSFVKVQGTSRKLPLFKIIVAPDLKICRGSTITLTAYDSLVKPPQPQNYSYKWDSAGTPLVSDTNNSVLINRPIKDIIYTLTVLNKTNGCADTVSTPNIIVSGFDLSISPFPAPQSCFTTDSVTLSPFFDGVAATPYKKLLWTDSSGAPARSLSSSSDLVVKSFRDSTRVYKLFVNDANGCFDSTYVSVKGTSTKKPQFSLLPVSRTKICRGEEITLTPVDALNSPLKDYTFVWDSLGQTVNNKPNEPVLIKKPQDSVQYTLTVTSLNSGCSQPIIIGPAFKVSGFRIGIDPVTPPPACFAPDSIGLVAKLISGNATLPLNVLWTDSLTGTASSSLYNPSRLIVKTFRDSTRVFRLTVRDAANCQDIAFVKVQGTSQKVPRFTLSVSPKDKICKGEQITLIPANLDNTNLNQYEYFYDSSNTTVNKDINNPLLIKRPQDSVTYKLRVRSKNSGCVSNPISLKINVSGFALGVDPVVSPPACVDPDSVILNARVTSGVLVSPSVSLWTDSLTGVISSSLYNPNNFTVKAFRDSTRVFKFTVKDAANCENFTYVKVQGTSRKAPRFTLNLSPKDKICFGEEITLTPVNLDNTPLNQYEYYYDSANVPVNKNINISVLKKRPQESVNYTLKVKSKNSGCETPPIDAPPILVSNFVLNIDPVIPSFCKATDSVAVSARIVSGNSNPPLSLLWTDSLTGQLSPSLYNPGRFDVKVFRDSTRVFKFTVIDASNCENNAFVKVQGTSLKKPRFNVSLSPNDTICLGQQITIIPINLENVNLNQYQYFYDSLGFIVNKNINNPILIKSPQDSVTYKLRVQSKNSGCFSDVITAPKISVNGFSLAIDPVPLPKQCSPTDSVGITARFLKGNPKLPVTASWIDSLTGKVSSSLYNPRLFSVKVFRDSTRVFKFTVQDASNCQNTAFVKVQGTSEVKPNFTVNVSNPGPICRGDQITLTAVDLNNPARPNDFVYVWDSAGKQVNTNLNNPVLIIRPKNTTVYTLTVRSKHSGCERQIVLPSIIVNGPLISFSALPAIDCSKLDSVSITATVTPGNVSSIQWTDSLTGLPATSLFNPNRLIVKAFRDTSRTYKLIVRDLTGCQTSNSLLVRAKSKSAPIFSVITGDTGVCVRSSVPVRLAVTKGAEPFTFTWKDAAGNIANEVSQTGKLTFNIAAVNGALGNTKKYFVAMQDADKCFPPVIDSINITLYDMSLTISGNQTSLCRSLGIPNPATDLAARPNVPGTGGGGNFIFKWTNLNTGQIVGSNNTLDNVSAKGKYEVEVTNPLSSCVRRESRDIQLLNKPEFTTANILPGSLCNNTPIILKASFSLGNVKATQDSVVYEWKVVNGLNTISFKDSIATYNPAIADTNSLVFKVITSNRCSLPQKDSAEVSSVKLKPGPVSKIYANPLETRTGKDVTFSNGTLNSDSVNVITFEDGFSNTWGAGNGQSLTYVYFKEGKFKTKLYTINKNKCVSKDSVFVTVLDKQNVFIPNVFSPNASQAENQSFRIFGQNLSPQDFNMIVYNRWGHVVFVTTDVNKAIFVGWDGKEGGVDSQMGVYTFAIKGKLNDGTEYQKTGTVTLLR